jgi:5'-methylthioadenosine phosphorylase
MRGDAVNTLLSTAGADLTRREAAALCWRMKVAFISGTSIARSTLFSAWDRRTVDTSFGTAAYRARGGFALINRHGDGPPLPPHSINHRANIRALADLGYRDVVSLNSVGSLKPGIPPGTVVSCSDYVSLQQGPATFFDRELKGGLPGIANNLVPRIAAGLAPGITVHTGKVYVQTRGPRFETKAEVGIIQGWGDVVGMTAASEADLCCEIGLRYNSLAIVDNFANGIEGAEIDFERFGDLVEANRRTVDELFGRMLEILEGD